MNTPGSSTLNRRQFLAGTGASLVSIAALQPAFVHAADAGPKINIGLIGCGGRGRWIAELFQKHGGFNVVAVSDYFQDRVDETGGKLNVPSANRYTGLNGYRKLLEQKLDAVVIQTPPYFHPEQAAAAVQAGKHVYMAKPIAVDVPGCLSIQESANLASSRKLCFFIDFQTRANKQYQDAVQKIRQGEIGKVVSVEAAYQCNLMFENLDQQLRKDPKNPELRLRAWAIDRALSGDIITEQNIHALDVACWMLGADPVRAYGTGGQTRGFIGNCWDRFAVIFHFPDDVFVSFNSRQAGFGWDDILCRLYGTRGVVDTHYAGRVLVKTTDFVNDGNSGNLYADGTVANIATFHENIVRSDCSNPTVKESVRSNLTTILGRMAAYENRVVTWAEMMKKKEKLTADLKGLKT